MALDPVRCKRLPLQPSPCWARCGRHSAIVRWCRSVLGRRQSRDQNHQYVDACLMYGWDERDFEAIAKDQGWSTTDVSMNREMNWELTWSSNDAVFGRQRCQCCRGAISLGSNAFLIPCFQWHSIDMGQCPYSVAAFLCFPPLISHAGVARTDASHAAKAGQERQRPMLDPTILFFFSPERCFFI